MPIPNENPRGPDAKVRAPGFLPGSAWLPPHSSLVLWIHPEGVEVDSPCPCDCLLALAPCVEGTQGIPLLKGTWTVPCLLSNTDNMALGSAGLGVHEC